MRKEAHLATIIDILDEFIQDKNPIDKKLDYFFKQNRFAGSKDKRTIREISYDIIRNYMAYDAMVEVEGGRGLMLAYLIQTDHDVDAIKALFSGEKYAPEMLSDAEIEAINNPNAIDLMDEATQLNMPNWLYVKLEAQFGDNAKAEIEALNSQAKLDLRVNIAKTSLEDAQKALAKKDIVTELMPYSSVGLRSEQNSQFAQSPSYRYGAVEIQDEAAQIASLLAGVGPKKMVVDYCAGGGGKTLAMASLMENKGQIYAFDINKSRLKAIKPRLVRASHHNVQMHQLGTDKIRNLIMEIKENIDVCLVDAPCSGTGTWRRAPDARLSLTADRVAELTKVQAEILSDAAKLVKKGGRLVYATCSILLEENEAQIEKFLQANEDYKLVDYKALWNDKLKGDAPKTMSSNVQCLTLTPNQHQTDGFFVAVMERV